MLKKILLCLIISLCSTSYSFAYQDDLNTLSVERIIGSNANVIRNGKVNPEPLKISDLLKVGDKVITDAATSVILRLGDGSVINLGHDSEFVISSIPKPGILHTTFKLLKGWLRAVIRDDPSSDGYKTIIQTPSGTIGVRGTTFTIQLVPGASAVSTTVNVTEGQVDVSGKVITDAEIAAATPATSPLTVQVKDLKQSIDAATPTDYVESELQEELTPKGLQKIELEPKQVANPSPAVIQAANNVMANAIQTQSESIALQAVKDAVNAGGNIEQRVGVDKNTILIEASRRGFLSIIDYLLSRGAKINAINEKGHSALTKSVIGSKRKDIYERLVSRKANFKLRDRRGKSLKDLANESLDPVADALLMTIITTNAEIVETPGGEGYEDKSAELTLDPTPPTPVIVAGYWCSRYCMSLKSSGSNCFLPQKNKKCNGGNGAGGEWKWSCKLGDSASPIYPSAIAGSVGHSGKIAPMVGSSCGDPYGSGQLFISVTNQVLLPGALAIKSGMSFPLLKVE